MFREKIVEDIWDNIAEEVMSAYHYTLYDMRSILEFAPDLIEVANSFYGNVSDNIAEVYEAVFGEAEYIREDWLLDLGITKDEIPNILVVCEILNIFRLGYTFRGVLYNTTPRPLLLEEVLEEDVLY